MVLHLFESYMLKDNKFLIFFYFTKEINHCYGPNTSLLFFVKIGIFQMQFAKIINSKKNYQFDFLVIETSLCINFKILSAHFHPFWINAVQKWPFLVLKIDVFTNFHPPWALRDDPTNALVKFQASMSTNFGWRKILPILAQKKIKVI